MPAQITAHKFLLAAASPYFEDLLFGAEGERSEVGGGSLGSPHTRSQAPRQQSHTVPVAALDI